VAQSNTYSGGQLASMTRHEKENPLISFRIVPAGVFVLNQPKIYIYIYIFYFIFGQ
jgi:hypothetical protein